VPYAAYIHPSNADSGAYGGMSFVIFPANEGPCLVAMVIGTQGLATFREDCRSLHYASLRSG
jgi:5-methylcytosine-specific restriction enzyme B